MFLSLFPKVISGPIVLWRDFQPQLAQRPEPDADDAAEGLRRIIIGYSKKAILADTFGAQIARIDGVLLAGGVDTPTMWLRALLYFFQLYYDFSGYSDIAIGLCRVFGFSIKENFNFPYISTSITEFWRRWHISLGSWFREYVYFPLGGNRRGNVYLNLFVVFLLTGIWHGANWTFLLWGVINGVFVVAERYVRNKKWYQRIPSVVKWAFTMAVVYFVWIMFMASDVSDAFSTYAALFAASPAVNFTWRYFLTRKLAVLLVIAALGSVVGALPMSEERRKRLLAPAPWKLAVYLVLFAVSVLFVVNSSYSPFLYFQF